MVLKPSELSDSMRFAEQVLSQIQTICEKLGISQKELSMGFVKETYPETHIVFGAEHPNQVLENLNCWKKALPNKIKEKVRKLFPKVDCKIIDPRLWPT